MSDACVAHDVLEETVSAEATALRETTAGKDSVVDFAHLAADCGH
jgi:hypothetical protein